MAKELLTDLQVRRAKTKEKPYRLFDGDGLALWISPSGAKSWQLRYRLAGKEQTATLGKLSRMTLAEARGRSDELRRLIDQGEHLTAHKHSEKAKRSADAAETFDKFSAAWVEREARRASWTADYKDEVAASIKNHLSELDRLPMTRITAHVVAPMLDKVERKAPNMLEKVRRRLRAILDEAVEKGIIVGNPLPTARRRARKGERKHYPAVTALVPIGEILRDARAADPCKGIKRAHVLLAFTALRVSEVVAARWSEFELDGVRVADEGSHRLHADPAAGNWSVPRERMKRKDEDRGPHVVPLPAHLLEELRRWRDEDGPEAIFVCPAPRDAKRHVTPEGVEKFYRDALGLAGVHSPHSWRSAFSTICREAGKDGDVVEAQLDHIVGTKVASAYDRAHRLELRRELMAWYERKLITARDGAQVHRMTKDA